MARPLKSEDYVVHRIAELIFIADGIHENEVVRNAMSRGGIKVQGANGKFLIIDRLDEIALAVGHFICGDVAGKHLKPKYRPRILSRLIKVLERRLAKRTDEIALAHAAWRKAKAKLKGGEDPTFQEVDDEFYRDNKWHLDRRALPNDCPVRPDKRGVKKNATAGTKKKQLTPAEIKTIRDLEWSGVQHAYIERDIGRRYKRTEGGDYVAI